MRHEMNISKTSFVCLVARRGGPKLGQVRGVFWICQGSLIYGVLVGWFESAFEKEKQK